MSQHDSYYKNNEAYAEHLASWDANLYAKYADTLMPDKPGARALDVGCGVGQVVGRLQQAGFEAHGVDVSQPNIERAKKISEHCRIYDGKKLPYPDAHFASVGALNVLEHVDEPEAFIRELVRVVALNGKIVISSPNFFRVFGFRDYHPKMRGVGNKLRNWKRLRQKLAVMRGNPDKACFDHMTPIVKEPFTPDDDAIVATNPNVRGRVEGPRIGKRTSAGCDFRLLMTRSKARPTSTRASGTASRLAIERASSAKVLKRSAHSGQLPR